MIYLASGSPRRAELLRQIQIPFETIQVEVDESHQGDESAEEYVRRLAMLKAREGWQQLDPGQVHKPVLAADTAVILDGEILGKPADATSLEAMIRKLAGSNHAVFTAVSLLDEHRCAVTLQKNVVRMATLTDAEICGYAASGEGLDKAGGYAIQGLAAAFITHLEGSYSGVMGLPLYETVQLLKEFDISVFPPSP